MAYTRDAIARKAAKERAVNWNRVNAPRVILVVIDEHGRVFLHHDKKFGELGFPSKLDALREGTRMTVARLVATEEPWIQYASAFEHLKTFYYKDHLNHVIVCHVRSENIPERALFVRVEEVEKFHLWEFTRITMGEFLPALQTHIRRTNVA